MKRALSVVLTLAMLLSLVTVFVVTPVSAATVIKNTAPAIRANVNETITLSNYSVVFDGDTTATSGITWKNGSSTITTFKPTAKGVTKLTATAGSKTKDIYVVAKNASDSEYVLYEANLADFRLMCNYGLTPTEWLQANYPEHYPSQQEMIDQYTTAFIEDYMRLKPKSADDFNERRSDKSRGWRCVARYHHLGTWTNLIKHLNLPKYSDEKPKRTPSKVTVIVHNDYDFRD